MGRQAANNFKTQPFGYNDDHMARIAAFSEPRRETPVLIRKIRRKDKFQELFRRVDARFNGLTRKTSPIEINRRDSERMKNSVVRELAEAARFATSVDELVIVSTAASITTSQKPCTRIKKETQTAAWKQIKKRMSQDRIGK